MLCLDLCAWMLIQGANLLILSTSAPTSLLYDSVLSSLCCRREFSGWEGLFACEVQGSGFGVGGSFPCVLLLVQHNEFAGLAHCHAAVAFVHNRLLQPPT